MSQRPLTRLCSELLQIRSDIFAEVKKMTIARDTGNISYCVQQVQEKCL